LIASLLTRLQIAPLYLRRYLIISEAAPGLLAGLIYAALDTLKKQIAWIACVGLLVALLMTDWPSELRNQDWKNAVALVNVDAQFRGWPVLVRSGFIEADELEEQRDPALVEYSLLPVSSIYRIDRTRHTLVPLATRRQNQFPANEIAMLKEQPGAWLITPGGEQNRNAAVRRIQADLVRSGIRSRIEATHGCGEVWLVRLRFQP
jgi:hypothetical protein